VSIFRQSCQILINLSDSEAIAYTINKFFKLLANDHVPGITGLKMKSGGHRASSSWKFGPSAGKLKIPTAWLIQILKATVFNRMLWLLPGKKSVKCPTKIFSPPTPLSAAIDQVEAWIESPSLILLLESEGYWPQFRRIVKAGHVAGGQIHDARIAALCELQGVKELWTADRDFTRFPGLNVRNPVIA
jgi:predicted nucleic acid-binding protein